MIAHEVAHVLHVRAIEGKEQEMGPVWFYEGFAVAASNQYDNYEWPNFKTEFAEVILNEKRGDYQKYGYIMRELLGKYRVQDLFKRAKDPDFNRWAISSIKGEK